MAQHHGRHFGYHTGRSRHAPVYGYFFCDAFDFDVSEKHAEIFGLLYAWADMAGHIPDSCFIHFADCHCCIGGWDGVNLWRRAFWHLERGSGADWGGADGRLPYRNAVIAAVRFAHVPFPCQREVGEGNPAGGGINDLFEGHCKDI